MNRTAALVAAFAATSIACAPAAPAPAPPGCTAPVYHRLDFWLGTWDVTDPTGSYEGTNVVSPTLGGCAVEERWLDARGHAGTSLFYVDRASGAWRQTWVTDEGQTKEKREIAGAAPGEVRFEGPDRTTLTPLPDGGVRQVIEGTRGSWVGIYRRVPGQCDTPEHHQLDFWLGDWSVRTRSRVSADSEAWTEGVGSNHVTRALEGCAIEESFRATGGEGGATWAGRSFSTWVARERRWRQTWVDDSGNYLAFTGGMQGAEMVLVGEPHPDGRVMRMVFGAITPESLSWRWEASTDGQKTWRPMLLIDYARLRGRSGASSP